MEKVKKLLLPVIIIIILLLPIIGLGMLLKLAIKKIPTLYIVAFATMISFIFSSGLIELIKNL